MIPWPWGAAGAALVGGLLVLDRIAASVMRPVPRAPEVTVPELGIPHEDIAIPSGAHTLKGWLLWHEGDGEGATAPLVLLAHGWGASYGSVLQLALPLVRAGYDVLLFDIRGHGRNEEVPFATVRHFRDDVAAAVAYAHGRFPSRALVLAGHSMGGAAAILAAAAGAPVAALVLIATPADVLEVTAEYLRDRGFPGAFMVVALRPFWWVRLRGTFRRLVPSRELRRVRQPVLIIQPGRDRRVSPDHAERLARASGRSIHVVEGSGHTEVLGNPATHTLVLGFLKSEVLETVGR